jgi:hypothetical protein
MDPEGSAISKKVEDFLNVFRKGEEFTQELLKENEKLRFKIAQLETRPQPSHREDRGQVSSLAEKIRLLEEENTALLDKFRLVEEEN